MASIRILQILSSPEEFELWLSKDHNKKFDGKIFQGYKFFVECTFSMFFNDLASEETLEMAEDFLFQCAKGQTIFIEKLPSSCERIVFLKNIFSAYKKANKSKTAHELKEGLIYFQDVVLSVFDMLIEKNCKFLPTNGLNANTILQLNLIENLYINFSQITNNGPIAYNGNLMKQFWLDENRLNKSLEGYKYTLQYLWIKIIGANKVNTTKLKNLHKADFWKNYTYQYEKRGKEDVKLEFDQTIYPKTFDLRKQTSLGSCFYRIKKDIILPLEKEYQINIIEITWKIYFDRVGYSKQVFNKLLLKEELNESNLSTEEELDMFFYWYPIEVFQPGQLHNGIPAFITLFAGTVALRENEREFEKVIVRKFIHPLDEGGNDYSYSILIDSQASAGHYSSGWLLYFDCCGDNTGFSGTEHKRAENIIEKYKDVIEFKSLNIKKELFKDYVSKYISLDDNPIYTEEEVKEQLDEVSNNRLENDMLGKARGTILELIAYYVHSQNLTTDSIKWNTEKQEGEIDVIIEYKDNVTIIECKVNPNNCNLEKEYNNAMGKLNKNKLPNKKFEFWFWNSPSPFNTKWLLENKINYTVLSNNCTNNDLLKGFDIGGLKHIFGHLNNK